VEHILKPFYFKRKLGTNLQDGCEGMEIGKTKVVDMLNLC